MTPEIIRHKELMRRLNRIENHLKQIETLIISQNKPVDCIGKHEPQINLVSKHYIPTEMYSKCKAQIPWE